MESKSGKISIAFAALACAFFYPFCMAQGTTPLTTVASAASPVDPAPEVRTEVAPGTPVTGTDVRPALTKELEAMKKRIEELEAEIRSSGATAADAATALQGAKTDLGTPAALQTASREATPLGPTPVSPYIPPEV